MHLRVHSANPLRTRVLTSFCGLLLQSTAWGSSVAGPAGLYWVSLELVGHQLQGIPTIGAGSQLGHFDSFGGVGP